jgi:hypothetical protein
MQRIAGEECLPRVELRDRRRGLDGWDGDLEGKRKFRSGRLASGEAAPIYPLPLRP